MTKIRIGISGYGNIGKGVEQAVARNEDMELVALVTRRDPGTISPATPGVRVVEESKLSSLVGFVDVMLLCGGSATDLPEQTPRYAALFHTLDSFDTHANIPEHFDRVDAAARQGGHLSLISCGWDPGLFSILRAYGVAALPQGQSDTFWGRGVSQGHSDAIRRIPGVKNGIQYTVPIQSAVEAVRSGSGPVLTPRQKHQRQCFVVAEQGADTAAITAAIQTMPNYFADYDTTVTFITEQELRDQHSAMPHGGFVFRTGQTGSTGMCQRMEFSLSLDSNPEFTGSVMVAYARAVARLAQAGRTGCLTVLDIAPALLCPQSAEQLRRTLL
ncbi:MAG: diaminopimelate dehydrogenase [Angelakisella sp.]